MRRGATRDGRRVVVVSPRRCTGLLAGGIALVVALAACAWSPLPGRPGPRGAPVPPLGHHGRWLTDATGRVVLLRGTNVVAKWGPYDPAGIGFDADDAAFLAAEGVTVVRVGVVFEALMPEPGRIDTVYVGRLARTVADLTRRGIFVLFDLHQDGWGPVTHGNGMPAWATLTDGLPNPPEPFPRYYVTNPALQRAFEAFWANRPGPDGVPLQEHYAAGLAALARRFRTNPWVLGYDPMNEPWPGSDWAACVTGCPELERERLVPFARRMEAALRAADPDAYLFLEPFVLFNFGQSDTILPGFAAPRVGLSTHVYALDAAGDRAATERAVAAAQRSGVPLLVTEFGATEDPDTIGRLTGGFDDTLVSWMFWSYPEHQVRDLFAPPTGPNLVAPVAAALARPYPTVVNGTPTRIVHDPRNGRLTVRWSTRRPDGRTAPAELTTGLAMPERAYPDGYVARVSGGRIVSRPCAHLLRVAHRPHTAVVEVQVEPGAPPGGCPGTGR